MNYKSGKIVSDPISGIIDIGSVLPIVESKQFQALSDKRQLGMTYLVFRSAMHSRLVHSLGAYHATKILMGRWFMGSIVTEDERRATNVYALLHDIEHPAFSHVTEDFCAISHDDMRLRIIRELRPEIEACDINFGLVEAMAMHKHPLYLAVSDKNLGMEKLDYLERDGFYTLLSRPVGVAYLRNYIYHVDGQVVVDEKAVEHTLDVLDFYMKMYKEVYFRKSLVIAQRMFHKAVYHLICGGELNPGSLPSMTDSELLGLMFLSKDKTVQTLYGCLRERRLFKEGIVIRPETLIGETRIASKPIAVHGVSSEQMQRLVHSPILQKGNQAGLENLEREIARVAHLPKDSVLVVPVFNPERFVAKDVMIYGSGGKLHSLRERRPRHFDSMEETARSYSALRVCVPEDYRQVISSPLIAEKVVEQIMLATNS